MLISGQWLLCDNTRISVPREDGSPVLFRGQFAAFTDPAALDMSALGRDITNLFAVEPVYGAGVRGAGGTRSRCGAGVSRCTEPFSDPRGPMHAPISSPFNYPPTQRTLRTSTQQSSS